MAADTIIIKGIREGLLVTLPDECGAWPEALVQLEMRLNASPAFFKGARMGLAVGAREIGEDDIRVARQLLLKHDATLWALIAENSITQEAAARLGLDTRLSARAQHTESASPSPPPAEPAPEQPADVQTVAEPADAAMFVRRTLRSGMSLRHPGSIVIIGDVHPGAEIIAGGDVMVWGKLHGTAHAGAFGNEEAVVCALDMAPTQLRIGHYITRSPDERRRRTHPETARVNNGRIEVVAWSPKSSER